jgi:serine/threonine protein kinase
MIDTANICLHCCLPKGRPGGCDKCGGHAPGMEVETHPMFLPPGTILRDQYLIGRVLGHGGFGVTYLCLDINLKLRVAIKEYLPTGENLASRHTDRLTVAPYPGKSRDAYTYGLQKFIEEGQALARFANHPNIVTVLNFFEAHGTAYLVMLFLEGGDLGHHIKKHGGRLPEEEAVQIITMVLDGLKAVHREGMLHRDISPDNIFLTNEGTVQLIDFGSARAAIGRKSTNISKIVKAGYSPFEQYKTDSREDAYTDLYAVGATLYHVVTGQAPPEATDRRDQDTLIDPADIPGLQISLSLQRVVNRALSMKPEDRFQAAADMLGALWAREAIEPQPRSAQVSEHEPKPEQEPSPAPPLKKSPEREAPEDLSYFDKMAQVAMESDTHREDLQRKSGRAWEQVQKVVSSGLPSSQKAEVVRRFVADFGEDNEHGAEAKHFLADLETEESGTTARGGMQTASGVKKGFNPSFPRANVISVLISFVVCVLFGAILDYYSPDYDSSTNMLLFSSFGLMSGVVLVQQKGWLFNVAMTASTVNLMFLIVCGYG